MPLFLVQQQLKILGQNWSLYYPRQWQSLAADGTIPRKGRTKQDARQSLVLLHKMSTMHSAQSNGCPSRNTGYSATNDVRPVKRATSAEMQITAKGDGAVSGLHPLSPRRTPPNRRHTSTPSTTPSPLKATGKTRESSYDNTTGSMFSYGGRLRKRE